MLTRGGLWTLTAEDNHVRDGPERGPRGGGFPPPWTAAHVAPGERGARLSTAPHRPYHRPEIFGSGERRRRAQPSRPRCLTGGGRNPAPRRWTRSPQARAVRRGWAHLLRGSIGLALPRVRCESASPLDHATPVLAGSLAYRAGLSPPHLDPVSECSV